MASSTSPPGLYTPTSTRSVESTPVPDTPVSGHLLAFAGLRKAPDRDQLLSAYAPGGHATAELNSDDLLFPQDNEEAFPLFPTALPHFPTVGSPMAGDSASPIEIQRQGSGSPRNAQCGVQSQFQQPRIDVQHDSSNMDAAAQNQPQQRGRQESVGMLGTTPYGARSIPMRESFRRESNALSGSLMNGMSWGGISVGSFIRDE